MREFGGQWRTRRHGRSCSSERGGQPDGADAGAHGPQRLPAAEALPGEAVGEFVLEKLHERTSNYSIWISSWALSSTWA